MTTTIEEARVYTGTVTHQGAAIFNGTVTLPNGAVGNNAIQASAEIAASKLVHRHSKNYSQDIGGDVVDATKLIHTARAAGTVKSVTVRPMTAPNGGDKQYTVDVRKVADTAALGASTSLLTTPVAVADADVDNTNKAAVLSGTPTYLAGDTLYIVIDATGTTGTQGQGFNVEVNLDESGV